MPTHDREPPYVEMRRMWQWMWSRKRDGSLTPEYPCLDAVASYYIPAYDWSDLVTPEALERFRETMG